MLFSQLYYSFNEKRNRCRKQHILKRIKVILFYYLILILIIFIFILMYIEIKLRRQRNQNQRQYLFLSFYLRYFLIQLDSIRGI